MFGGMIIIWVLIIVGIVWLVKYVTDQKSSGGNETAKQSDALEILKVQYARGEISREEFEERKKVLEH